MLSPGFGGGGGRAQQAAPLHVIMTFNPDIHHRQSIRMHGYDYSCAGAYFVTICVYQRECLFGEVVDGIFVSNDAGKIVAETWLGLLSRFPSVSLDEFTVMPNHFHGILVLGDDVGAPLAAPGVGGETAKQDASNNKKRAASSCPTLGDVMRAFKSISAISVNRVLGRQGLPLWQRNYYERVIRDEEELDALRQYVAGNPKQWAEDENHPSQM